MHKPDQLGVNLFLPQKKNKSPLVQQNDSQQVGDFLFETFGGLFFSEFCLIFEGEWTPNNPNKKLKKPQSDHLTIWERSFFKKIQKLLGGFVTAWKTSCC